MQGMGARWSHVQNVGAAAEALVVHGVDPVVAVAAWLHDIGYSARVRVTGFHPLDGAKFLALRDAPSEVVSLVAYHTGAEYEAAQRGFASELATIARPSQDNLDALTFVDLTVGPTGERVTVDQRISEILERYPESDPVHLAVQASSGYLRECATRAELRWAGIAGR